VRDQSKTEVVTIESKDGSGPAVLIDRASNYEVTMDLTAPAEARFEVGDNGTWKALKDALSIGRKFRVALNGRSLIGGRLLMRGMPVSAASGATVQLTVRTSLADAYFASCDPINVTGATLKTLVLKAYATIGVTERDFIFNADVNRDVLTGLGKNTGAKVDLSTITEQNARVQHPETVYSFADRHLRRFGLMHWDGYDGTIVVGKPNDSQSSSYLLRSDRQSPRGNNILDARRTEDYEQVPSVMDIYGQGGGRDYTRASVKASVVDPVLNALTNLKRRTMVIDESVTTAALAEARARREMATRSIQRDSWDITLPSWCHYYSNRWIPYAIDTVADVYVDVAGGVSGQYYIWRSVFRGSANDGHTAQITAAAKGVWVI
jgi:prophage tail gpP-like protein